MEGKHSGSVTIIQVAKRAGVSTATAGRVLGNYGYASEDIKARVQEAAVHLGYRPNRLARGLITGKTHTIGVVAGDITSDFYAHSMRGIADVARRRGVGAILANSDEQLKLEQESVQLLLEKRVDGLIVSPCDLVDSAHLRAAVAARCPVVQIDRVATGLDADSVTVDNRGATAVCMRHLFAAGHTRIAFVGELESSGLGNIGMGNIAEFAVAAHAAAVDPLTLYPSWQRLLGYLDAYRAAGIRADLDLVRRVGAYSVAAATTAVHDVLGFPATMRPTAIFAAGGRMSTGAMAAIASLGLRVPADISLVCFDDLDWMSFIGTGITTVVQPVHEMGTLAADLLLARIDGDISEYRHIVLPAQIAMRGSIGSPDTVSSTWAGGAPAEPR